MSRLYKYYIYILASSSGTLYTGVTGNLVLRVQQHKEGIGSFFTKKYSCNKLVYYEQYASVYNAIKREKEIKAWRRSKKEKLIKEMNPHWNDLFYDLF